MQPFTYFPVARLRAVRFVLTDVDDTLTDGARLPAATYSALERLADAGFRVIPITAAPAGWCDLMCRMWPVAAVVGENGGLCFRHDRETAKTERRFWASAAERQRQHAELAALGARIAASVGGASLAADQPYRETTLAFANPGVPACEPIIAALADAGARSVVNSLWVLGWLGGFDKLAMTRRILAELFATDLETDGDACIYVGDSMNDEPMFGFFANSVGVATVRGHVDRMTTPPRWVTEGGGGSGFVEIADALLRCRADGR
ncbi:MAG TPA: HAD family hydrolase [Stellaceae bacterium]|nr:HAD family hydrolase [Stellaceae bacterium]